MSSELITKVKELRAQTAAGLSECREALEANNLDLTKAIGYLREKGIVSFKKRKGNPTKSGDFGVYENDSIISLITLLSETDFVANTTEFKGLANEIAKLFADNPNLDITEDIFTLTPQNMHLNILAFKENIKIGMNFILEKENGPVYHYIHKGGSNLFAGIIQLEEESKHGRDVAVHIAYTNQEVDSNSDKSNPSMTQDNNNTVALLDQPFFKDPETTIGNLLGNIQIKFWQRISID